MSISEICNVVNKVFVRIIDIIRLKIIYVKRFYASGRKTILFYPEKPKFRSIIYKICHLLGYRMTSDLISTYLLAIAWQDKTYRDHEYTNLAKLFDVKKILNDRCIDISKVKVEKVFRRIFGYSSYVNPKKYHGICVKKSNINARHDGEIVKCPVKKIIPGFVYMKLLNNQVSSDLVMDLRIPIFLESIPFIYLKYRQINNRFSNTNLLVKIAEVREYLSQNEINKILLYCNEIGLDTGELDMIRDKDDGKLYIIDVANTPSGPPNHLSKQDKILALKRMCFEFKKMVNL